MLARLVGDMVGSLVGTSKLKQLAGATLSAAITHGTGSGAWQIRSAKPPCKARRDPVAKASTVPRASGACGLPPPVDAAWGLGRHRIVARTTASATRGSG